MRNRLLEDLRIDPEGLVQLNLGVIGQSQASGYKRRQLGTLLKVTASMQEELG